MNSTRPDMVTLAAFTVMVFIIATNVVAIPFSNQELPPMLGAGVRFAAASLIFLGYVLIRRHPIPRGRTLAGVLLFGVLQFGIGYSLLYWALLEVPAGLMSIILATVPLFTLLFAGLARIESPGLQNFIGAVVALGGIAVIFGGRFGEEIQILFLLAAVAASAVFALAGVLVKLLPRVQPASMNGVGMLMGSLILLALSTLFRERVAVPANPVTWLAYLYLVLIGSVVLFSLLLFVLNRWTATAVSYQVALSPIVAVLLSAWLLDEPITTNLIIGGALVVIGVYIGALAPGRQSR